MMRLLAVAAAALAGLANGVAVGTPRNDSVAETFYNPVLPGWHSDPSCTRVEDVFFCATSTFIAFPGLPVYASKDLVNWRLASHAWSREAQLPNVSWITEGQMDGMYAPTLRYRDGEFFLICEYLNVEGGIIGVLFRTTDPFDDDAWSDPLIFRPNYIDPDLFFDDDGKVYVATQTVVLQELDLETGELSQPPIPLWNGTGGVWPEGPHIYKRDGWYYLMIAEGGTALDHAITIARARSITGPYEPYENNPILTNRGTDEYFQTVGHGDLFTDVDGNWWGLALATRSGPEWTHFPMGREAVLFPATWEEGEWPVLEPVRGAIEVSGRKLPERTLDVPGDGPFNNDPDEYDFPVGEPIPRNLMYWRVPRPGVFSVSDAEEGGLRIAPGRGNLTGDLTDLALSGQLGLSFIGRRQTSTLFKFSVEAAVEGTDDGEIEYGATVFLTQYNHIDLSIVGASHEQCEERCIRLSAESQGNNLPPVEETIVPVPDDWSGPINLEIEATSPETYQFSVSAREGETPGFVLGQASSAHVSGSTGPFTGTLLGVFSTCNGRGSGDDCPASGSPVFRRWRYASTSQYITADEAVPADWSAPQ